MRVLLTGHRGYLGSVLIPALQAEGHEVEGLDSGLFEHCAIAPLPTIPETRADLREVGAGALEGFEAVIHLAGLSNDPLGDFSPDLTESVNHLASLRLAKLAKQAGVRRFLYASSCSVYGAAGESWLDEDSEKGPVTAYAISKLRSERDLIALADGNFCPTFMRAGTAYGLSPMIRFDLVVNNLAAWAAATGVIRLKSDGSAWRPVVHVEDIAQAYVAILGASPETVAGQAFNVGITGENYRVIDLAEAVREVFADCRVERQGGASADVRCYRVNCDKIAHLIPEFRPRWSVRKGAEQLRDAFQATAIPVEDFEGPRYQRLAHLKSLMAEGTLDQNLRWRVAAAATS